MVQGVRRVRLGQDRKRFRIEWVGVDDNKNLNPLFAGFSEENIFPAHCFLPEIPVKENGQTVGVQVWAMVEKRHGSTALPVLSG